MRRAPREVFQGHTFKEARHCVPQQVDPKDAGEVEWNPASDRADEIELWPSSVLSTIKSGNTAQAARGHGASDLSTCSPEPLVSGNDGSEVSPPSLSVQEPFSPSLSAPVTSSPPPSFQVLPKGSSVHKNCVRLKEPDGTGRSTYDEPHELVGNAVTRGRTGRRR